MDCTGCNWQRYTGGAYTDLTLVNGFWSSQELLFDPTNNNYGYFQTVLQYAQHGKCDPTDTGCDPVRDCSGEVAMALVVNQWPIYGASAPAVVSAQVSNGTTVSSYTSVPFTYTNSFFNGSANCGSSAVAPAISVTFFSAFFPYTPAINSTPQQFRCKDC